MAPDLAIDVQGIGKRFGDLVAVDGVGLQVRRGEICGFLGPNGSGKTTFLRMLCGLLRPDAGSGQCLGLDVIRASEAIRRQVGYMTQKFSFWEDLTVAENMEFVARLYGVPERRAAVRTQLERMGLQGRANQLAGTLSGGWKQRLALAACLLHRPQLLLLDEPTAGVDPQARRDFWEELHRLAGEGLTVLVTTHYMDEAERCHRLAFILAGRLLAEGTGAQIVARSGLATWAVRGPELAALRERLRQEPGVEQAVVFGHDLHVSGPDAAALAAAVARHRDLAHHWRQVESSLEDVFIHLMQDRGRAVPAR